jgi:hypothetical protein
MRRPLNGCVARGFFLPIEPQRCERVIAEMLL